MAVQNLGTTYHLGLDFNTIDTTAYALIVIGRYDLAKEFLLATGQSEELVNEGIAKVIETLKQAKEAQATDSESTNKTEER